METYDALLLLTGGFANIPHRSKKVLELYKNGASRFIIVSGGFTGVRKVAPEVPEAQAYKDWLCERDVPEEHIYAETRSRETLGNFTFLYQPDPKRNFEMNDLENIALVTETNHMQRSLSYAEKVIPKEKITPVESEGLYKPGLAVSIYNKGMHTVLSQITEPSPQRAHDFLQRYHPFYRDGWMDKPQSLRRVQVMLESIGWIINSPKI